MMVIPRTTSIHGDNVSEVQKSFHSTCHILNKLQYPTICEKIDHGSDKFNFYCVTKTPHFRSFPEMLDEAMDIRNIVYSEYFVSQIIGSVMKTVLHCHEREVVNVNLNINNLGFDKDLRPILQDFSRSVILTETDKIDQFVSIMSSTPPELALLMGPNNPLMYIELNGNVLRKADSWRCGVLLYVLITGQLPYYPTYLGQYITQVLTLPPTIPIDEIAWVSDELKDLLYKLLETTYFNRIDIKDALKHEWFNKIQESGQKIQDPRSLPSQIMYNIINLWKLQNARNWISAITHKGYYQNKQLDRDRKYYGRCDPTGMRKVLKRDKLVSFLMDRLGYCKYKANEIIDRHYTEMTNKDKGIEWRQFLSTYNYVKWNESDPESVQKQLPNAMFRGLDPNGTGFIDNKAISWTPYIDIIIDGFYRKMFNDTLLSDINKIIATYNGYTFEQESVLSQLFGSKAVQSNTQINQLVSTTKVNFENMESTLMDAFKNEYDIKDWLSIDHAVVQVLV